MARWKLISEHYLMVPGTEWQYSENDRKTNRPITKKFPVPLHLDPKAETDWNVVYRANDGKVYNGDIVVCLPGKGEPGDIEFTSHVTPDMEPIDDEAKAISEKLAHKWERPAEAEAGEPYARSLLAHLESKTVETGGEMKELKDSLAALTDLVATLTKAVIAQQPTAPAGRRVA
jgi:hypothetical protein